MVDLRKKKSEVLNADKIAEDFVIPEVKPDIDAGFMIETNPNAIAPFKPTRTALDPRLYDNEVQMLKAYLHDWNNNKNYYFLVIALMFLLLALIGALNILTALLLTPVAVWIIVDKFPRLNPYNVLLTNLSRGQYKLYTEFAESKRVEFIKTFDITEIIEKKAVPTVPRYLVKLQDGTEGECISEDQFNVINKGIKCRVVKFNAGSIFVLTL